MTNTSNSTNDRAGAAMRLHEEACTLELKLETHSPDYAAAGFWRRAYLRHKILKRAERRRQAVVRILNGL